MGHGIPASEGATPEGLTLGDHDKSHKEICETEALKAKPVGGTRGNSIALPRSNVRVDQKQVFLYLARALKDVYKGL